MAGKEGDGHVAVDDARLGGVESAKENHEADETVSNSAIQGVKLPLLLVALCLSSCIMGLVGWHKSTRPSGMQLRMPMS